MSQLLVTRGKTKRSIQSFSRDVYVDHSDLQGGPGCCKKRCNYVLRVKEFTCDKKPEPPERGGEIWPIPVGGFNCALHFPRGNLFKKHTLELDGYGLEQFFFHILGIIIPTD